MSLINTIIILTIGTIIIMMYVALIYQSPQEKKQEDEEQIEWLKEYQKRREEE